jgi:hypothetical protein
VKDQIVNFVIKYPIVLIPIVVLVIFARFRRIKRRTGHINDPTSKLMLVVGFIVAFLIIAAWLLFS